MEIIDIPNLLHFSKILIDKGYLPKIQARRMVRNYKVDLDNIGGGLGFEKAEEAIKEFSHWLHERV